MLPRPGAPSAWTCFDPFDLLRLVPGVPFWGDLVPLYLISPTQILICLSEEMDTLAIEYPLTARVYLHIGTSLGK
jgi:hypothetical protein